MYKSGEKYKAAHDRECLLLGLLSEDAPSKQLGGWGSLPHLTSDPPNPHSSVGGAHSHISHQTHPTPPTPHSWVGGSLPHLTSDPPNPTHPTQLGGWAHSHISHQPHPTPPTPHSSVGGAHSHISHQPLDQCSYTVIISPQM